MNPYSLFADYASIPTENTGYGPPVNAKEAYLSSVFGPRSAPTSGASRNHGAYDIVGPQAGGITTSDATAIQGGTVTFAGSKGGYGLTVEVTHPNGDKSRYSHLDSLDVKVGDEVGFGQPLGSVGSTGVSTGAHLDFGLYNKDGQKIDPATRGYGMNPMDSKRGYPSLTSAINPNVTSLGPQPINNLVDYGMAQPAVLDGGLLGTAIADVKKELGSHQNTILNPESILTSYGRQASPQPALGPQEGLITLLDSPQAPTPPARPAEPARSPTQRVDEAFGLLGNAPTLDIPSSRVDGAFQAVQGQPTLDVPSSRVNSAFEQVANQPALDVPSARVNSVFDQLSGAPALDLNNGVSPTRGPDMRSPAIGLYDRMNEDPVQGRIDNAFAATANAPTLDPVQSRVDGAFQAVQGQPTFDPVQARIDSQFGLLGDAPALELNPTAGVPTPTAKPDTGYSVPTPTARPSTPEQGLVSSPTPTPSVTPETIAPVSPDIQQRIDESFGLFGPAKPDVLEPVTPPELDAVIETTVAPGLDIKTVEPPNPTPAQAASPAANATVTVKDDLMATGQLPDAVAVAPEAAPPSAYASPQAQQRVEQAFGVFGPQPTAAPQAAPAPAPTQVVEAAKRANVAAPAPSIQGPLGQARGTLSPESLLPGLAPAVRDLAHEIGRAPPDGAKIGYSPTTGTANVYSQAPMSVQVAATGPGLFGAIDETTGTKIGSRMEQGLTSMGPGFVGKGMGGAAGGAVGTMVGGPVGGLVGGLLGSLIGGRLGRDSLDYAAQRYGGVVPTQASSISYGPGLLGGNDGYDSSYAGGGYDAEGGYSGLY